MLRERLPDLQWIMAQQHLYTGIVVGWFTLSQTRRTGKTAANGMRTRNEHFVVIIFTTHCCSFVCVLASPLFTLKDAMPVSFRSELFTSYIITYISIEAYSRKYEKLPNIVVHACKNMTEKNEFVENSALFIYVSFHCVETVK